MNDEINKQAKKVKAAEVRPIRDALPSRHLARARNSTVIRTARAGGAPLASQHKQAMGRPAAAAHAYVPRRC